MYLGWQTHSLIRLRRSTAEQNLCYLPTLPPRLSGCHKGDADGKVDAFCHFFIGCRLEASEARSENLSAKATARCEGGKQNAGVEDEVHEISSRASGSEHRPSKRSNFETFS